MAMSRQDARDRLKLKATDVCTKEGLESLRKGLVQFEKRTICVADKRDAQKDIMAIDTLLKLKDYREV